MEIEMKFLFKEDITKEKLFNDSHLVEIIDPQSDITTQMKAIYYDTGNCSLCREKMAFRIRYEGDKIIATLKWGGSAEDGLHVRGELNVPVSEDFVKNPDLDIFKGSETYEEIIKALNSETLLPVMEMNYSRREVRVDTGRSISVISWDEGEIKTEKGSCPISEIEIELYSGDKEDMVKLGRELASKYNLEACNKSKFQRGLEILGVEQAE